ncbi:MAG TPA: Gfo/Idh/MocA family oxidoreductase [Tepidisphaeraceae bacterium]|nr:Gfo/Idh/MocA family oxidoreductase [Tepidisphaeraceae bacterium]
MPSYALVGCAHIHTPGFIKMLSQRPQDRVRVVWDHDQTRGRRRADELGARFLADERKLYAQADVDAAIVCSETDRHEPLVVAAAEAGKHLFVEKPLGLGSRDAYAMAEAIRKAGVIFQTGYFQRGRPEVQFLRSHLAAGSFGKVTRVRGSNCHSGSLGGWFDTEWRWMADPKQAGCGAFGDLGTHALDILIWLLGDVTEATAMLEKGTGRYGDCDETGEGLMRFASGAIGTLAAGWTDVANPVQYLISGTEGHAAVIDGKLFFQSQRVDGADGKQPWTDLPDGWPHAFELFLDAVGGKDDVPLVSAYEAAYRSAVLEAMYEGAKSRQWVAPK